MTGLLNNGGSTGAGASGGATTNHKFSLTPVNANTMTKTISIAGQPVTTGNKFYMSLVNSQQQAHPQSQQITLTNASGGQQVGTKSLQYLTPANIKFNLMTTSGQGAGGAAGQAQDIKSILASSLPSNIIINDHPGNNLQQQGQSVAGGASQQQQQQVQKRYLYTNNRGQFMAQLNPAKMVNIVPVQASSGAGGAVNVSGGGGHLQQQQQVLSAATGSNSNTKIITTTKGVQQAVLDSSGRILSTTQATAGGRGFQPVQRLRTIRNPVQQQQQQQVVTSGGGGTTTNSAGEVRTFNRILIQSAPGAGAGATVSIGGGAESGGNAGSGSAATAGGSGGGSGGGKGSSGGATVSSINVNAINR